MAVETEVLSRTCSVMGEGGAVEALTIRFYAPTKNPDGEDYLARANIACPFFDKDVYGTGEDAPQAFFWLPTVVVSYLIGQRRFGYETYWSEKGDLDYSDFWAYRR